jgi:CHAT domain-containing protein/Tfp pilus assembly protein PilF
MVSSKNIFTSFLFFIILLLLPFKTTIPAETEQFDITRVYKQITTHPEIDLYPSISPDGKWIAFASKRSGNMDIWIKPIAGGSATQITTHRTDDVMPSWAPDGKKLVFVSYRDDALGDLWLVSIKKTRTGFVKKGDPFKITSYLGVDATPVFSPGGQWIAFTSDRGGIKNIYIYNIKKKQTFQITQNGGINPTWSHDKYARIAFVNFHETTLNGQIFYAHINYKTSAPKTEYIVPLTTGLTNDAFPFWNPNKNEIIFTRYDEDNNDDGQIDPDDKPGLWKIVIKEKEGINEESQQNNDLSEKYSTLDIKQERRSFQEIQLIPKSEYDFYPVCSMDSMTYFVSDRSGNKDVWSVSTSGPITRQQSAFFQYQFASAYFPILPSDLVYNKIFKTDRNFEQLEYRLLAFNRVLDFFPEDNMWSGWALYEIAKTLSARGDINLAKTYYLEILVQFVNNTELVTKAKIRLLELDAGNKNIKNCIDSLRTIIKESNQFPEIQAEAQLFIGEVFYLHKQYHKALVELEKVVLDYNFQHEWCAVAQLLIGDIYSKFGQTQDVINAYLKVLKNYPHQESWLVLALDRIMDLSRKKDNYETISEFRNIISSYGEYGRVAAYAQLCLGKLFVEVKDSDAAVIEYGKVFKNFSDQGKEAALAELALAEIYLERNQDIKAFQHYRNVVESYGHVQGGEYVVEAKERLVDAYIQSGNRLIRDREFNAAYTRFRSAIEIIPRQIDAHRNMVATMYMSGRIDEAIQWYEAMLVSFPNDEILLYMLGLCYSYKATENSDKTGNIGDLDLATMKKSTVYIETALSKNYRIIQGYLTLSYNYEFIEKYESLKRNQDKNFFTSLITTVTAPIKSLYYMITFQRERTPEQWFELAIDALTTAITLNDEKENSLLESELALNLANNFYNLGEFGFESAYYYYQKKLQHDSTFFNIRSKAEIYKKMGHCAFVIDDYNQGPKYLKKAMQLYKDFGDDKNWLVSLKMLALLYQSAGEYDESVEYFKQAANYDEKKKRYQDLEIDFRSIAYNYQLLNDEEEAIKYGQKALRLIKDGKVETVKSQANWIKIGILGIEFPVWNLGQIGAGASTAAGGFTTDEEKALIYSIIGQSNLGQKSVKDAIYYLEKKLKIFRHRKDKIAEAIFLNNIAYLHYLDFNYGSAWEYYEKSYGICNKEKNVPGMLINIINIGSLGVLINKLDQLPNNISENNITDKLLINNLNINDLGLRYLHSGLTLFKNEVGYAHEEAQIYALLGSLHFWNNNSPADSGQHNQYDVMRHQLYRFDQMTVADSCYQTALQLSKKKRFSTEEMHLLIQIGNLSYSLGDVDDALDKFLSARQIAANRNDLTAIWQTDFMIGKILSSQNHDRKIRHLNRGAEFYLNEAITTLEQSTHQLEVFRVSPFYQRQVRLLFETAIEYAISSGSHLSALRLTEQYHGKQYLDLIGSHKLELKKERHKLFLGNARFLKNEITSLDKKITFEKEKNSEANHNLPFWIKQKKIYQAEYAELLEDLTKEDPELESFIVSEPVTFSSVQKILSDQALVIDYFFSSEQLNIWTITATDVNHYLVSVEQKELVKNINTYISDIKKNASFEKSGQIVWDKVIRPVVSQIDSFNTIIVIPDRALNSIPFNYLLNFTKNGDGFSRDKNVILAPGLSSYYYGFLKRKIKKPKLLWVSSKDNSNIFDLGYDGEILTKRIELAESSLDKFVELLTDADLTFLDIKFKQNEKDPLISEISLKGAKSLSLKVKDLYKLDLQSSLIITNGANISNFLSNKMLQKALMYTGTPSLIFSDSSEKDVFFWEYFFDALLDYPVAQAVTKAQKRMKKQGESPSSFAFYQVIGFEGMNDIDETQFAKERFESKVALGNQYYDDKDWHRAVKNYEQAMVMAKKQGATEAINNLYQLIIECSANGRLWEKAIDYQLEIVEHAKIENDVQTIAEGYKYLVYFYTQNKNYDRALYYQNEYLTLAQNYNLPEEIAGSYRRLGLVYEQDGEFIKADDYLSRAIKVYRELGDSLSVADCLKDRGRIHLLKFDNYSQAINDQKKALLIFQKVNASEKSLEVLQNLGLSHEFLANYKTALKYQLEASSLADELGSLKWIALSKQYLANVYWKMGNYEQALRLQKQALKSFEEMNNKKFQAVGLSTQGLILLSLGNVEEALRIERDALEISQQLNDSLDMATIHKNISAIFRSQKRWDEALAHIEYAKQIDEKIGSRRGLGYDFRDLGIIKLQKGLENDAFDHFRKGLKISREIFDARNMVQCLYQIGKTYGSTNNFAAAIDTLELTAQMSKNLNIPEVEWRALRMLAIFYGERNDPRKSLNYYNMALKVIEEMRSEIKVEEYKSGFMDNKLVVYDELVNLYLKLKQPARALEIVERAKSRNFIDLLANRDINFSGDYDKEKFKHVGLLKEEIGKLQHETTQILVKQDKTKTERNMVEQLTSDLNKLKRNYQDLLVQLKEQNPELANMVSVEPLKTNSLQSILPNRVLMIEYFYNEKQVNIWAVKNDFIMAEQVNVNKGQLIALVDSLRKTNEKQVSIDKLSKELYNILISPVESAFVDVDHIVIVPHGVLHYLPFACLAGEDNNYLVDKFSLSLSPSAMVLNICLDKGDNYLKEKNWKKEILAFGNPDLGDPQFDLPFAELEIQSIKLLYPNVSSFINSQATEKKLKDSSKESNLFVFSCHGEFDPLNPLFSALLLSPDDQNDGRLEAHEIFELEINAYLVSMSACETGLAKIGVGDDVVGLSRSFIYAGAASLLSSLWKVDDLATAILMKRFFRNLRAGLSRAQALQKAQQFVRNNINVHPVFWSAFNITGDFR